VPQINPTVVGKQLILSADAASARTVLQLGSTDSPTLAGLTINGNLTATGTLTSANAAYPLATVKIMQGTGTGVFTGSTTTQGIKFQETAGVDRGSIYCDDSGVMNFRSVFGTYVSIHNAITMQVGSSSFGATLYIGTPGLVVRNRTDTAFGPVSCSNLVGSGTITASGTGTHTFGTTNTVTMAAGVLKTIAGTKSAPSLQLGYAASNTGLYGSAGGTTPGLGLTIGGNSYFVTGDSNTGFCIHPAWGYCWGNSQADSTVDTRLTRASAGVVQLGTTAVNALGSLLLTNLTASGTVQFVNANLNETNVQGLQNFTARLKGNDTLEVAITSSGVDDGWQPASMFLNTEDGIGLAHGLGRLDIANNFVFVASSGRELGVSPTGYLVSSPTDFRTAAQAQKTITSGTPAPSGGVDGDIYLRYT
jgi:hypothetical protein